MRVYNGSDINIYFGQAADQLFADNYLQLGASCDLMSTEPFCQLKNSLHINKLYFLKQVHGTNGLAITQNNKDAVVPFCMEGDYLITREPGVGLGIMSADCLPIVAIDKKHKATGIAHAGWRGSVNGVGKEMIKRMFKEYDTNPADLTIFFGSSAHNCCYVVGNDLISHVEKTNHAPKVLHQDKDAVFFDLPLFNQLQLQEMGIPEESFNYDYANCTIDNHAFFSHRRQGGKAGRQMTVVGVPLQGA